MTPEELGDLLRSLALGDVLVPGFIDDGEDPARFHAVLTSAFLDFGRILIEIRAVESEGTLAAAPVDQVRNRLDLDDDMRPSIVSIRDMVIQDPDGDCQVTTLRFWNASSEEGHVSCDALEIDLASGQVVFIDPTFHFGLRFGGSEQRGAWSNDWPGAKSAAESVFDLTFRANSRLDGP